MIDAHSHLPADHPDLLALLDSLDLKVVNICVDSDELGGLDNQRAWYCSLIQSHPHRFAWCTSFSLAGFGQSGWTCRTIAQLSEDFANGAIAAKIWKNVGMELRDPATGQYVFVDDARFAPVFEFLQTSRQPVLMHIAEPLACWRALDPASPHHGYYASNPQWHWYNRPGVPTHEQLIATRDAVVERYSNLIVIGAHFGSLEYDLDEVAKRLDRYPNFYVDTSARMGDIALLARQDREHTRRFFIRYAARILWGVDWVFSKRMSELPDEERARVTGYLSRGYARERQFYASDDLMQVNYQDVHALALPGDVLEKMFLSNARRVYRV